MIIEQVMQFARTGYICSLTDKSDSRMRSSSNDKTNTAKKTSIGSADTSNAKSRNKEYKQALLKCRLSEQKTVHQSHNELEGKITYFIGNDQAMETVCHYKESVFKKLCGSTLILRQSKTMEYDFVVAPNADVHKLSNYRRHKGKG